MTIEVVCKLRFAHSIGGSATWRFARRTKFVQWLKFGDLHVPPAYSCGWVSAILTCLLRRFWASMATRKDPVNNHVKAPAPRLLHSGWSRVGPRRHSCPMEF